MEQDIKKLLSQSNQMVLNILELISENKRWYSIRELSVELGVVERTIQRYIHQLEEIVDEYNELHKKKIELRYEKYKGITLDSDMGVGYFELKGFLFKQDETIRIFEHIILKDSLIVSKYASENFISENSVKESLKKIKELLKLYNLTLSKKDNIITGEEKQIRLIIYIVSWLSYKGASWPFEVIDDKKVYQAVDYFSEMNHIHFSYIQRRQLAYMLAVCLVRLRKNHIIEMEDKWKSYVNFQDISTKMTNVEESLNRLHVYIKSEIYFYAVFIQVKTKFYQAEDFRHSVLSYHKKNDSDVYRATVEFKKEFESHFGEIPKDLTEPFFITSFCAHMFCSLFTNINVDIDGYYILGKLEYHYPNLGETMSKFLDELYSKTGNKLYLEKEFLLQKYMLLFSSIHPLPYYEPKINIFLDSDLPLMIQQNIRKRITDRYKHDYNVRFVNNNYEDIDLILTNIPNSQEEKNRFTQGIQLFEYPITPFDLYELEQRLIRVGHMKSMEKLDKNE